MKRNALNWPPYANNLLEDFTVTFSDPKTLFAKPPGTSPDAVIAWDEKFLAVYEKVALGAPIGVGRRREWYQYPTVGGSGGSGPYKNPPALPLSVPDAATDDVVRSRAWALEGPAEERCWQTAREFFPTIYAIEREEAINDRENVAARKYLSDPNHRREVDRFDNACLKDISTIPNSVRDVVGVLMFDGVPFCTASHIERFHILTARHCFFRKSDGQAIFQPDRIREVLFQPLNNAQAVSLAEIVADLPVPDGTISKQTGIPHPMDLLVARLSKSPGEQEPRLRFEDGNLKEHLLIVGVNSIRPTPDWREAVRVTADRTCHVAEKTNEGCIYYGCQPMRGFSGAPVFRYPRGGTPEIVGIHVAPAKKDAGCSGTLTAGNIAASVPISIRSFVAQIQGVRK